MYQRTPKLVPLESQVKTALCVLKSIQHQIACGTIEFGKLYTPGYLADLDETSQIFESIVLNITAYDDIDYPDLDNAGRGQLEVALQAALDLLEATKTMFSH